MSVYLGDQGFVEIKRDSLNKPLTGTLTPSDVNTTKNRFSFDIGEASLISGDQVNISTADKSNLVLVDGATGESYRAYVSVDLVGGIRLYETFEAAICDNQQQAIPLVRPTSNQKIIVSTRNSTARCVAQVTSYDLTTSRDTVDITSLGEEFRRNYANGLISGQGSMECLWDHNCGSVCDSDKNAEFPHYLAQLVIRTQQGADFDGFFYLDHSVNNRFVWYESKCIITSVAMTVEPTQLIRTRVQFVTTGDIRLKIGVPPAYVLQEEGSLILLEDSDDGLLQEAD